MIKFAARINVDSVPDGSPLGRGTGAGQSSLGVRSIWWCLLLLLPIQLLAIVNSNRWQCTNIYLQKLFDWQVMTFLFSLVRRITVHSAAILHFWYPATHPIAPPPSFFSMNFHYNYKFSTKKSWICFFQTALKYPILVGFQKCLHFRLCLGNLWNIAAKWYFRYEVDSPRIFIINFFDYSRYFGQFRNDPYSNSTIG